LTDEANWPVNGEIDIVEVSMCSSYALQTRLYLTFYSDTAYCWI
jgi:hypothetical protein